MRELLRRLFHPDREPDPATTGAIQRADAVMASLDRIAREEHDRAKTIRLQQMRERKRVNLLHDRLSARAPGGGD